MKYKIVSNGEYYKIQYKASWYSPYRYLRDNYPYMSLPLSFTTLEKAEAFIKEHVAAVLKAKRKYEVVKEFDLSKLEIALADTNEEV